jgi:hypothetical protein
VAFAGGALDVQVNSGAGAFNALETANGNNYVGMLTIMI